MPPKFDVQTSFWMISYYSSHNHVKSSLIVLSSGWHVKQDTLYYPVTLERNVFMIFLDVITPIKYQFGLIICSGTYWITNNGPDNFNCWDKS